jgi:hypothetical protein
MGEIRGLLIRVFTGVALCAATATAVDQTLLRESFAPLPLDLAIDKRIDAYVPFYRRMMPLLKTDASISSIDLRTLADDWIRATQDGKLQPMQASFYGENFGDTPKGQLLDATLRTSWQLSRIAQVELENGLVDDAVADSIRATSLIDSVRFASPTSMTMAASVVRLPLKIASANVSRVKNLPPLLVKQLELRVGASARFREMMRRSDQLKLVYSVRYGDEDAPEAEIPDFNHSNTDAQHFYSIDREQALEQNAKACRFVNTSQTQ